MANESKTEAIVRTLLARHGYLNNEDVIVEEKASDNPRIDKLLRQASKFGKGKGYPEFIISFRSTPDNVVIIECKADIKKHESQDRKQYRSFAVDGVLLYASHLKDHFNVMAIAVSGETEREMKISHFLWLKGKRAYRDVTNQHILDFHALFNVIAEHARPISDDELIKKAIEYNKLLQKHSIPQVERCTIISSILVALQDDAFVNSYRHHHSVTESDEYNPNEALIDSLLSSCKRVLTKNSISKTKGITYLT